MNYDCAEMWIDTDYYEANEEMYLREEELREELMGEF